MSVHAIAKSIRISPRKVREVAALVRGHSVKDAITILEHTPRRAALPIAKAIASAKANAVNNHGLDENSLIITTIDIGEGPAFKRYRPAAHGRALPYQKRSSHVKVVLDGAAKKVVKKKTTAKKTTKKDEA